MPQLMPLVWFISNLFIFLFVMMMVFIYSSGLKGMKSMNLKGKSSLYQWCW